MNQRNGGARIDTIRRTHNGGPETILLGASSQPLELQRRRVEWTDPAPVREPRDQPLSARRLAAAVLLVAIIAAGVLLWA